jgi:AcrR family transcriptional regulator
MPKIVDYEEKKKEIALKAIEVFIEKGYYSTNISDIAKRSGMGRTNFYQYFSNKDEIYDFAIDMAFACLRKDFDIVMASEDDALSAIAKIVRQTIDDYRKNDLIIVIVELWLVTNREKNRINEGLESRTRLINDFFFEMLEKGYEKGQIGEFNLKAMADLIYIFTEALILQMAFHGEKGIEEKLDAFDVLLKGLRS